MAARRTARTGALLRTVDRLLRVLARLTTHTWFRSVEVEGADQLARSGPLVVAASHANGFIDPVVLVAVSPRPLRFLAKSTLWKVPGLGAVLGVLGALPVTRPSDRTAGDDGPADNRATFAAAHAALGHDGAVAIFPEGTVNDTPQVLPVKTGAARIALGARADGTPGVRLLPVGLVYGDKAAPRSRVLVRVGEAIDLDADVPGLAAACGAHDEGPGDHALVAALTERLAEGLRRAALHLDGVTEADALTLAAAAQVALRTGRPDPMAPLPMGAMEPVVRALAALPPEQRQAVARAQHVYEGRLALLGLTDGAVLHGPDAPRLRRRLRSIETQVAMLAPGALVGACLNGAPYLLVRTVSRRPMARISRATTTVLAGLVAFPAAWTVWGLLGRSRAVRHPWRWSFTLGPLSGLAAVRCADALTDLRTARLSWQQLAQAADLLDDLRAQRTTVVSAVEAALADRQAP